MDLTLTTDSGRLNVRVAAVILSDNKILIEKSERVPFAVCPGGRVKFGETAERAIERELFEEFGEKPRVIRPLYVHQNFFDMNGYYYHELCFFFLTEAPSNICGRQTLRNLDGKSTFSWVDVDKLQSKAFFPTFLKQSVTDLPKQVEFVTEYKEGFKNGIV